MKVCCKTVLGLVPSICATSRKNYCNHWPIWNFRFFSAAHKYITTNYRQYFSFSCDVKFKCNFVIATTLSSQKLPWLKKISNCCNLMDNALFHLHVHSDTCHKSPIMFCKLLSKHIRCIYFRWWTNKCIAKYFSTKTI